ncbi:MAG TPA: hypothetical protein VJQ82_08760 [Terriglobales bacterium]|nr:hypothetical protein [Terriglobales bacterium]
MASQGALDHPSYLTRTCFNMGLTSAGANGTSGVVAFPNNMRVRNVSATVTTAGTSATSGNQVIVACIGTYTQFGTTGVATAGTTTATLGTIVLGTSAANVVATSGDLNTCINAGSILYLKNGTDATGVARVAAELHVDPLGSWVGGAYG